MNFLCHMFKMFLISCFKESIEAIYKCHYIIYLIKKRIWCLLYESFLCTTTSTNNTQKTYMNRLKNKHNLHMLWLE